MLLAGSATALATGFGAIPVSRLGARADEIRPALWGLTVGMMGVASIVGLLLPALDEGSDSVRARAVCAVGVAFLLVSRRRYSPAATSTWAKLSGARACAARCWCSRVLFVHSLPGGAGDRHRLRLRDGGPRAVRDPGHRACRTCPRAPASRSRWRPPDSRPRQQFWAAVATSAPQPVGALVAYALVKEVESLLSFSFAFAAGAMLALVMVELVPQAFRRGGLPMAFAGTIAGGLLMIALAVVLGV